MKLGTKIKTLDEIIKSLACGNLTSEQLVDEAIENTENIAYIFSAPRFEDAKQAAKQADLLRASHNNVHPCFGVPVVLKDVFAQKGIKNQGASRVLQNTICETSDSALVKMFSDIGMFSLGRTNMSEFAFSGIGYNPHFGTPMNVWSQNEPLIPGGSSSGTAIAVAQGLVSVGIGSDTSGSIRIPAALNGLVGFKPTSFRISKQGMLALSPTLDSVGIMTHTMQDMRLLLNNFGFDCLNQKETQEKPKFIVPCNLDYFEIDKGIKESFENAITQLVQAGYAVEYRNIKTIDKILDVFSENGTLVAIEAYISLMPILNKYGHKNVDPLILNRLNQQKNWQSQNLIQLLRQRSLIMQSIATELDDDLLLMPTTTIRAVTIAKVATNPDYFTKINKNILTLTMLGNFLDMPSLALPTTISDGIHPDSIMVSAVANSDEKLLFAGQILSHIFFNDEPVNNLRMSI